MFLFSRRHCCRTLRVSCARPTSHRPHHLAFHSFVCCSTKLLDVSRSHFLSGNEALRRREIAEHQEGPDQDPAHLTNVWVETASDGKVTVTLTGEAFLDDYYHRGLELAWMSHYIYAMFVAVTPRSHDDGRGVPFLRHYVKFQHSVQTILYAPRIPFMTGFTLPCRAGDPATNALFHLELLKPGKLCAGNCRDIEHLHSHVFTSSSHVRGGARFVEAWRSWEALQLTRAGHAWRKLTAERRVAGRAERCCGATLPGASRETVVRDWVLPWLQGGFRHVYRSGRQPRSISKPSTLRLLPALPLHLAVEILRFVGHIVDATSNHVIIADTPSHRDALLRHGAGHGNYVLTGTGCHPNQLYPQEFAASIAVEVSHNLDLLAEARRRPRPNTVIPETTEDPILLLVAPRTYCA